MNESHVEVKGARIDFSRMDSGRPLLLLQRMARVPDDLEAGDASALRKVRFHRA